MAQAPPTQVDHPRGESCHGDPNLPPRLHKCAKTASLLLVEFYQIALVHRSSNTHQLLSLAIKYAFDQQNGKTHKHKNEHGLYGENNKRGV